MAGSDGSSANPAGSAAGCVASAAGSSGLSAGTIPDAVANDPTSCHHGVGTSNGGSSPSTTPSALTSTSVTVRVTTRILTSADACQQPQLRTCSSFARTPLSHD